MPYKSNYSLGEFWSEITQGTIYRTYARANPVEASAISALMEKKIKQEPHVVPIDLAKTHTGRALVMVMSTLKGGDPTGPPYPTGEGD